MTALLREKQMRESRKPTTDKDVEQIGVEESSLQALERPSPSTVSQELATQQASASHYSDPDDFYWESIESIEDNFFESPSYTSLSQHDQNEASRLLDIAYKKLQDDYDELQTFGYSSEEEYIDSLDVILQRYNNSAKLILSDLAGDTSKTQDYEYRRTYEVETESEYEETYTRTEREVEEIESESGTSVELEDHDEQLENRRPVQEPEVTEKSCQIDSGASVIEKHRSRTKFLID